MCEFWRSSHWVQRRHGGGGGRSGCCDAQLAASTQSCVVTTDSRQQRHCLEHYRVKHEGIIWLCQWSCRWPPLVSCYYVIVLCLQSSDKWRRRLNAVDGLDWALTRLMWLVQTYLDHPTIFHIYWWNLTSEIGKIATRIDHQFLAMSDALCHSSLFP